MSFLTKYEMVTVAYRSRFIFRTDALNRDALGVSLETIAKNRDSERDIDIYYNVFNHRVEEYAEITLGQAIGNYVRASEFYRSVDWGDRSQLALRKKFCRLLFRYVSTKGMKLSTEEDYKFKIKDDDGRLIREFFPDGVEAMPAVSIPFILLFVFDIVRPWNMNSSRGHDVSDKDAIVSLERLRNLIELLREDTPQLGSAEKPKVFDQLMGRIDYYLNEPEDFDEIAPLFALMALENIEDVCRTLVGPETIRTRSELFTSLNMPGIWIDNTDKGKNRFWVFPDNKHTGYCYERDGVGWRSRPFECIVHNGAEGYIRPFIMYELEVSLKSILKDNEPIPNEKISAGICSYDIDETTDELNHVELIDSTGAFPSWLDWTEWTRLSPDDERYKEFHEVLSRLYDLKDPLSAILTTVALEMAETYNKVAGWDRRYIYVYDRKPSRYALEEIYPDHYGYYACFDDNAHEKALFELEISEESPLYLIPRYPKLSIEDRKKAEKSLLDLFRILDEDGNNIPEVHIIHSPKSRYPILYMAEYGCSMKIDMDQLSLIGVRKLTQPLREI